MTDRPHVPECQCDRCLSRSAAYPPYCLHCHQVLTKWNGHWTLWGWAGRGMSAPQACLCPQNISGLHVAVQPGERIYNKHGEVAGYRFTRHADGTLSPLEAIAGAGSISAESITASRITVDGNVQPHCTFCFYGLEWKNGGWWAEANRDGHLYCGRNPDPASSKHVPVGPSCTMGRGCDCPFHDDTPWPDPVPRQLKSGGRYWPRGFPVTDGPASDRTPKVTRPPLDELYASTTGRELPADTYAGWGAEWVDTGIAYARERMAGHVTLAEPAGEFRWNAPEPVAAPPPVPELAADKDYRQLRRESVLWLVALALSVAGFVTGWTGLVALGAVLWFMQLSRSVLGWRIKNKTQAKAVEGKHAKSKSG